MRGARILQKLFFALAGCRRHCAITGSLKSWRVLSSPDTILHWDGECGLLRHSALNFHDRWNVCWCRFLCVRVTRLVCVRQAPNKSGVCDVSGGLELPGVPFVQKPVSEENRIFDPVFSLRGGRWHRLPRSQSLHALSGCMCHRAVSQRQDSRTEYGSMLLSVVWYVFPSFSRLGHSRTFHP